MAIDLHLPLFHEYAHALNRAEYAGKHVPAHRKFCEADGKDARACEADNGDTTVFSDEEVLEPEVAVAEDQRLSAEVDAVV